MTSPRLDDQTRTTAEVRSRYRTVLSEFPPGGSLRGGRRPVVVGVDGSDASLHALKWAVDLATDLEVEVIAVHASSSGGAGPGDRLVDLGAARPPVGPQWCRDWTDALHGQAVYRVVVADDPAAIALVEVCRDESAHCLVIGTRHGFEHSHEGALLAELTMLVGCPLLVVPLGAEDGAVRGAGIPTGRLGS